MQSLMTITCIVAALSSNGMPVSAFMPYNRCASHVGARPRTTRMRPPDWAMKIKVGLVGLPNVGKSTLMNAIAQKSIAEAKNFPFCTIEPNIAPIGIPDANLSRLATVANSKKALPAFISLIDVAGLVKGASRGEGLGNKFLATIRECNLIVHVIRNFVDEGVVHVDGKVDPVTDAEVVNLELILADLSHIRRRLEKSTCTGFERDVLLRVERALECGVPARSMDLSTVEEFAVKSMGLLTLKPMIYAINVDEVDFAMNWDESMKMAKEYVNRLQYCDSVRDSYLVVSAKLESSIGSLSTEQRNEYLESIGVECDSATERLSYYKLPLLVKEVLNLALVYTGPGVPAERSQTTKAHLLEISDGITALDLAGKLHGDIQNGFIHAEVINSMDLVEYENYGAAKDGGKIRMEGKEYIITAGDVVLIKWR